MSEINFCFLLIFSRNLYDAKKASIKIVIREIEKIGEMDKEWEKKQAEKNEKRKDEQKERKDQQNEEEKQKGKKPKRGKKKHPVKRLDGKGGREDAERVERSVWKGREKFRSERGCRERSVQRR